ncbi:MAG: hypothetical protein OXL97_05705 [Chloroflexota bacterium]|nr:hypothetical protein [Chloroflexota bacterium]MDE2885356.1 hypothetical protein [Chloroflexota bacterium]
MSWLAVVLAGVALAGLLSVLDKTVIHRYARMSFFAVVYAIALSMVWRGALAEVTTPATVTVKLFSSALIVGGVIVIAIGSG